MATGVKLTVRVDASLVRVLDRASRRTGVTRSQLVQEALRLWQRIQLEQALKEGYQTMAEEDRATAETHLRVAR